MEFEGFFHVQNKVVTFSSLFFRTESKHCFANLCAYLTSSKHSIIVYIHPDMEQDLFYSLGFEKFIKPDRFLGSVEYFFKE
jgi:hypothetical protein